jgi:hypothetical protein
MLFGLLFGNLIDLDHIFFRVTGMVPWMESICSVKNFWDCNSFFGYPLHSVYVFISLIAVSIILFFLMQEEKELKVTKWMFWICIGALVNLFLDFIQLTTGTGFVISG